MKVSLLINSLRGNGSENVCITIANQLYKFGFNVEIITFSSFYSSTNKRLNKNIKQVNLKCDFKSSLLKLPKYINKSRPNILISFEPENNLPILITKYLIHNFVYISRCVNTLSVKNKILLNNEKDFFLYLKKKIVFKSIELLYKYSDVIIAQCNGMKNDLIKNFNVKPEKCVIINNPIREEFIFNFNNSKIKNNYILCVGRLHPQKAFDVAIKCFAKISSKHQNMKLIIAGKGKSEKFLRELVSELNLVDKVKFIGYTNSLQSLYEKAKFTLLTSKVEGFPNNLLESIAVGTPVVAFDCPSGPSEIIEEGINGFLVKNRDENDLVMAMDKALTFNWNVEAIHLTSLKYSIDNIIPKYIDLLNKIRKFS